MKKKQRNYAVLLLIVALLAPRLTWSEGSEHSHQTSGHPSKRTNESKLRLDHGKKWETDGPLRAGMNHIRSLIEVDIQLIHMNKLVKNSYASLAKGITAELNQIFRSCKLEPEADATLHSLLVDIIAGNTKMNSGKTKAARRDGALQVIGVLNQYGEFFDHPGWAKTPDMI